MAERFDVVIVGARCAGSPLATLLARAGVKVAVVEQATFPRDTLSTHLFLADALAFLDKLGVIEDLRATGAPFVGKVDNRVDGFRATLDWPRLPSDVGGMVSVRRIVLDPILARAAEQAGADVRMATKVTGLVRQAGDVSGVRVKDEHGESELHARLVVGADGRRSTVAELCAARKYNVTPNERAVYWGYFEGAEIGAEPTFVFHRWADRFVLGAPCDNGRYEVLVLPELGELPRFRDDLEGSFMEHARSCEPVARAIAPAQRVDKIYGMVRWSGYFREASGPGWVLAGDAGHFKDPAAGRGIGDAFDQVQSLAPAIIAGLGGTREELERELARWGRARDRQFAEHYWFGTDLGKAGSLPSVLPEMGRRMHARGEFGEFLDIQNHRVRPSRVITPPRVAAAVGGLLLRPATTRRALVRELGEFALQEGRRRYLNRRPAYLDPGPAEGRSEAVELDAAA
jgi:flavin-dependent dehydrogenase